jgi:S-adenosylhomocysteine hydrolase
VSSTAPTARVAASEVAALQTVLAGEHAAVYGYGVVGAHLRGRAFTRAQTAYDVHRTRRDQLRALLNERAATPVAAAAAYRLPRAVETAADARLLATELEERLAAVWLDAVAALEGELRELAGGVVQDVAVWAAGWRGGSVPFPGLPG